MKKLLITGGTGFIGGAVIDILLEKGYEIHLISSKKQEQKEGIINHQLDLLDSTKLSEFFAKNSFESAIHLAWYVASNYQENDENLNWLIATLNFIKLFQKSGGKKFLAAGSVLEYDLSHGYLSEDLSPVNASSLYASSKTALYKVLGAYCKKYNIDFKWARIFNVYGPFEKSQRLMPSVIISCLKGENVKVSKCLKFQDYLYVSDMASGIVALFESDYNGAMNICSNQPVQLRFIVEKIAELTNFKGEILYGKMPENFSANLIIGDNQKLLNLGWEAKVSLELGLEKTIKWWKDNI